MRLQLSKLRSTPFLRSTTLAAFIYVLFYCGMPSLAGSSQEPKAQEARAKGATMVRLEEIGLPHYTPAPSLNRGARHPGRGPGRGENRRRDSQKSPDGV